MKPWGIAIAFASVGLLSACNPNGNSSLATGAAIATGCPSGGCVDTTAKATDTRLQTATATRYITAATGRMEVQGDCFVSTFPQNFISLQFKLNGSNTTSPNVMAMTVQNNQLYCENGKFYFIVDVASLAAGSYSVVAQLNVKATGATTWQAPVSAKFTLPFIKN